MYDELVKRLREAPSDWYDAELHYEAANAIEELSGERNKGEWLEDFNGFETIYRCSKCSEEPLTKYGTMHDYVLSEFCPHCGADMMENDNG